MQSFLLTISMPKIIFNIKNKIVLKHHIIKAVKVEGTTLLASD